MRVLYSGRVQGVGFRATCHSIAARREVGGFVRNLADGRVELVVEGDDDEVRAVLAEVARAMSGNIRETVEAAEPPAGQSDFRIER